jgi:hypothetical protein
MRQSTSPNNLLSINPIDFKPEQLNIDFYVLDGNTNICSNAMSLSPIWRRIIYLSLYKQRQMKTFTLILNAMMIEDIIEAIEIGIGSHETAIDVFGSSSYDVDRIKLLEETIIQLNNKTSLPTKKGYVPEYSMLVTKEQAKAIAVESSTISNPMISLAISRICDLLME